MLKIATFYKLLQRKCYDVLSLQYGFLFIIISSFLLVLSLIRFGETWLDWSRNKYEAIFSSYSDNIIEKSFHHQLCQKVPIDVVYTWVNGSDPIFLEDLNRIIKNDEQANAVNKSFISRYEDLEELRYSLRSLEMYAPWIHHVFLVTNGQIPYWLDMDHPRLTVITHKEIFINQSHLPTFSSPAIESHLHRIPGLSKYFLYLNDDIILGRSVWPEDFLTESEGYKIFVTWNLPDCSPTCTWSWVGDGSCDPPCNIEECSYDGGDCNSSNSYPKYEYYQQLGPLHHSSLDAEVEKEIKFAEEYYQMLSKNVSLNGRKKHENETALQKRRLLTKDEVNPQMGDQSILYVENSSSSRLNFSYLYNGVQPINMRKEILDAFRNSDKNRSLGDLVRNNNDRLMHNNKLLRKMRKSLKKTKGRTRPNLKNYYNIKVNNQTYGRAGNIESVQVVPAKDLTSFKSSIKGNSSVNNSFSNFKIDRNFHLMPGKVRVLDMFAESLLYVNRLYNTAFGVSHRKVPAHMPHFINKDIMNELQDRFQREWNDTSSHKLRSKKDMQFAFSYYYFIVGQKVERGIGDLFDDFDTDGSGTWSDREIRTLLTRIYGVPLSYPIVLEFEEFVTNCSRKYEAEKEEVNTPLYERYSDSKLPTITKSLIKNCQTISEMLKQHFGTVPKYKFEFIKEAQQDILFKMITSNLSKVIEGLDIIRSRPRKFICLNNNMDSKNNDRENAIVRAVLQDFYQSLYPKRSSFELSSHYRNRFLNVDELKQWKRERDNMNLLLLFTFIMMSSAALCCACQGEV